MVISFDTSDLQECCCEFAAAESKFGYSDARSLMTMLADLEAFNNGSEILDLYGSNAIHEENASIVLEFGSNFQAKFVPVGRRFEIDAQGWVKWQTVSRLKLMCIERRNL